MPPARPALGPILALPCLFGCDPASPPPADSAVPRSLPPFTVLGRLDRGPLVIELDAAGAPIAGKELRGALDRALELWVEAGAAPLVGTSVRPPGGRAPADLAIRWDDGSRSDSPTGRDTSVATTRRPGPAGEPGELLLDARRPWRVGSTGDGAVGPEHDPVDLTAALAHELGHVLGLGHVEDPTSVMHPQRELAARAPGPGDRAGLRTLYGDAGASGSGDLVVHTSDGAVLALRGVAPAERCAWTLFDTDGDGRDELLVWATEPGDGALAVYRFEAAGAPGPGGPRLARTDGPFLGLAGHGARVTPWLGEDGGRWLASRWPDGSAALHRFDERGVPRPADRALERPPPPVEMRTRGDLDGDLRPEHLEPGG